VRGVLSDTASDPCAARSSGIEELLESEANIVGDATEKNRRDVASLMDRNRGAAAIGVAELLVGTLLTDLDEAVLPKELDHLTGRQNGNVAH
jgi:hypothetical protein